MASILAANTRAIAIDPTGTELDRWMPGDDAGRICVENTDATQTFECWMESRPILSSGNFGVLVDQTQWSSVGPLETRDVPMNDAVSTAGELRFMARASGAGGTINYTRRRRRVT